MTGNLGEGDLRAALFFIFVLMMKRLLLMLALLSVLPAAGQTGTATFGGRITGENGPIEGVTVVAIHQQTNAQYYATTDRGGWYQLLDVLPGGPYTVRIHYFGYDPLTVRGVFAYAGQNTVVDADLEARTTRVHTDEAATSLRLGPELGGGTVPVSPLGFDLVNQRILTPVSFDVRQESPLVGESEQWVLPTGSNRFHGSAYGFYGTSGLTGGLNVATPLWNQDYEFFGGAQYDVYGFSAAARFDGRLDASNRFGVTGGHLSYAAGNQSWAGGDWFTTLSDGAASNRVQARWSSDPCVRQLLAADDFTLAAGRHRLLAGIQFAHRNFVLADSTASQGDIYVQDALRLGQRMTLVAGVRFALPFAFSPRLSLYYDVTGKGSVVLRAGTAVYGRHGEGTIWKNLTAVDIRLPAKFYLTLEGIYGQSWRRAFYISSRNILDSHYALTARLERPLADRFWALVSYTRSDGSVQDRIMGGFSYKAEYLRHYGTQLSVLYDGGNVIDDLSPASISWSHGFEARLSQDFSFQAAGRDHTLQLTGYVRRATAVVSGSTGRLEFLAGLRYIL